jgi:hypothetical protein
LKKIYSAVADPTHVGAMSQLRRGQVIPPETAASRDGHCSGSPALRRPGDYGTNYLWRAAVADFGWGPNLTKDAIYPSTKVDSSGATLTGTNTYVVHFDKGLSGSGWLHEVKHDGYGILACKEESRATFGAATVRISPTGCRR